MEVFKKQCVKLRREGCTVAEIMKATGRSKSSVYFHIRHIPLSARRKEEARRASGVRAAEMASRRKGKSLRTFTPIRSWSADIVSLLGHLLFDGEVNGKGCIYNNRSEALVESVEKAMRTLYAFEPKRYINRATGVHRIAFYNVALSAHIKEKIDTLLQDIADLPLGMKIEFLKAFFDDEGCADFRPAQHRRSVRGYQKDKKLLLLVQRLLADVGIASRCKEPNEVVIVGKEDLSKFERLINFSRGVYVNGERTNSRWKKHIEKRAILGMALSSFNK